MGSLAVGGCGAAIRRRVVGTVCCVSLLALGVPCWAALGATVDSVAVDSAHMKGSVHVVPAPGYSIHEIQTPGGQTVREFVSPAGQVFALAWEGPGLFDLRQLLGEYFDQYKQAMAEARPRGNTPVWLQMPGFVFQLAGTMGSLHGQAYIPQMMPAHFDFAAGASHAIQ
jgi:Protein of unknown function (DUF2844)